MVRIDFQLKEHTKENYEIVSKFIHCLMDKLDYEFIYLDKFAPGETKVGVHLSQGGIYTIRDNMLGSELARHNLVSAATKITVNGDIQFH